MGEDAILEQGLWPWLLVGGCLVLVIWDWVAVVAAACRVRLPEQPPTLSEGPAIVVVVSCKGETEHSRRFFQHLMAQRYRPFRVIMAVESAEDTALGLMRLPGMAERSEAAIAALAVDSSQKVANLIAGLGRLRPSDEILVLADADHSPPPTWLGRLAAPLVAGDGDVVSGYRVQLPRQRSAAGCFSSALDNAVATAPRPPFITPCWGGSTAAWRKTWERVGFRQALQRSFNDDLLATGLFYRAGLRLRFPRDLILPTEASQTWEGLLNYVPRQYVQVRWYAPVLRWLARLGLPLPVLGWSAAFVAAASGFTWGWVALGLGHAAAFAKAFLRRSLVRNIAGGEALPRWRRVFWLTALLPWLLALLHLALGYRGVFGRTVVWAGTRYRIDGPKDVKVLRRQPGVPA